jgi:hypothetical protein
MVRVAGIRLHTVFDNCVETANLICRPVGNFSKYGREEFAVKLFMEVSLYQDSLISVIKVDFNFALEVELGYTLSALKGGFIVMS